MYMCTVLVSPVLPVRLVRLFGLSLYLFLDIHSGLRRGISLLLLALYHLCLFFADEPLIIRSSTFFLYFPLCPTNRHSWSILVFRKSHLVEWRFRVSGSERVWITQRVWKRAFLGLKTQSTLYIADSFTFVNLSSLGDLFLVMFGKYHLSHHIQVLDEVYFSSESFSKPHS